MLVNAKDLVAEDIIIKYLKNKEDIITFRDRETNVSKLEQAMNTKMMDFLFGSEE